MSGSMACTVEMEGRIVSGDAARLDQMVQEIQRDLGPKGHFVQTLVLNSAGGDVAEALLLADVVRNRMLWTTNFNDARFDMTRGDLSKGYLCASSCFIVLLAGAYRSLWVDRTQTGARIGLHRPYMVKEAYVNLTPGQVAQRQQTAEETLRRFALRERVPENLVNEMMSRSSTEVYWLSPQEAMQLIGEASWYEEIKIARCGWSPALERAYNTRWRELAGKREGQDALNTLTSYQKKIGACMDDLTRAAQAMPVMGSKPSGNR